MPFSASHAVLKFHWMTTCTTRAYAAHEMWVLKPPWTASQGTSMYSSSKSLGLASTIL